MAARSWRGGRGRVRGTGYAHALMGYSHVIVTSWNDASCILCFPVMRNDFGSRRVSGDYINMVKLYSMEKQG